MSEETYFDYVEKRSAFLTKERQRAVSEKEAAEKRLAEIDHELLAMSSSEPHRRPTQGKQRRRGQVIIDTIRNAPDGMTRGELLERMGLKNDARGEASVSNYLFRMTRYGTLVWMDKRYFHSDNLSKVASLSQAAE